ncbi:MAG: hypothetical protein II026_06540 [Bacteroidales bacterium]|nr:hypothetical protein [Bacteroidales bacterium]
MKRELERLAARGLSATDAYATLRDQLWSAGVGTLVEAGELRAVDLASDRRASFDVWNLRNESITIGGLAFSLVALVFFLPAWIKPD